MPWSESPCRMVLGWEGGLFETFPSVAAQIRKAGQYDPSLDRIRMIGFGSPMFNLPIFLVFSLPSVAVGACRLTRTISYFHFPPSANMAVSHWWLLAGFWGDCTKAVCSSWFEAYNDKPFAMPSPQRSTLFSEVPFYSPKILPQGTLE